MLLREVQIDRGLFEIAMTEQDLDGAQIGSGFEQVRREAVPQGMRMDVPVLKASANRGLLAGCPEHLGGDRTARRMPPVAGKQPLRSACAEARASRCAALRAAPGSASRRGPCGPCRRGCGPPSAGCRCRSPSGEPPLPGVLPWHTASSPGCAETVSRSHRSDARLPAWLRISGRCSTFFG